MIVVYCETGEVGEVLRELRGKDGKDWRTALPVSPFTPVSPKRSPSPSIQQGILCHYVYKLGDSTLCGLQTSAEGNPNQVMASAVIDHVDCDWCLKKYRARAAKEVEFSPVRPFPTVQSVGLKHCVLEESGIAVCSIRPQAGEVAHAAAEVTCPSCASGMHRAMPSTVTRVPPKQTSTSPVDAFPIATQKACRYELRQMVRSLREAPTTTWSDTLMQTFSAEPELYQWFKALTVAGALRDIEAPPDLIEKIMAWVQEAKIPFLVGIDLGDAAPSTFAALAAQTDKLLEGQKRIDNLVGIWLQNFGTDGPQPDRMERLISTFAGFGSKVAWKYIESKGGLASAILDAMVRNSWASQEAGAPSRTKLAKKIALNMIQVGSASGFPLREYTEACVVHTSGEIGPDGSREPDDSPIVPPMCKHGQEEAHG